MNYNDKKFRPVSNTENGETSNETLFHYKQVGNGHRRQIQWKFNNGRNLILGVSLLIKNGQEEQFENNLAKTGRCIYFK